jgi:SAM-dependent methyltransferase
MAVEASLENSDVTAARHPQAPPRPWHTLAPRFDPARYDAWYDHPLGRYCLELEQAAILCALRARAGERVLEVGAGTGRFAIAAAAQGAQVVATDPDTAMAAWGAHHRAGPGGPRWLAAAGARLPFPSAGFDAAFTVAALCFAPNHAAIVREMARVVRPGGRVVLGELNALAPWQWWRKVQALSPCSPYRHARFHTAHGLNRMLREAGLRVIHHEALLYWLPIAHPRLLRWAPVVERWGRRLAPGLGAFVVVAGVRSPTLGSATVPAALQ